MLDAVILDLGNVLAFHDNVLLFAQLSKAFGTTPELMKQRLEGGLWEKVNRGQLPGDALRMELQRRLGNELSPNAWFELWNCHFTINEPMVKVVERLVGKVRLVLLSNTHDQHVAFLRARLPVLERFDGLVLSCEEGLIKPESGIYLKALEVAQVEPERAAFFDDVPTYAEAATMLGLHGRLYTDTQTFVHQLAALGVTVP
jgi:putative hydrolase of the HAD superfamily